MLKEPESGHAGAIGIVLTALWVAEFGDLTPLAQCVTLNGRQRLLDVTKLKALLFLYGYHKNVFYIFMWKLLLISHLGYMLICVCVCLHIGINLGEKKACSRPGLGDHHQLRHR